MLAADQLQSLSVIGTLGPRSFLPAEYLRHRFVLRQVGQPRISVRYEWAGCLRSFAGIIMVFPGSGRV